MSEAQYACAGATPPADGGGWGVCHRAGPRATAFRSRGARRLFFLDDFVFFPVSSRRRASPASFDVMSRLTGQTRD